MDRTFLCPYCNNGSIKLTEHMYCGNCFAEMRSGLVTNLKHAVWLSGGNDLYSGSVAKISPCVKIVAPASASTSIFNANLYAIFPAKGMSTKSPLAILWEVRLLENENFVRLEFCPQSHPQLDSPFDRFFVKGLLYSGIGNAIAFAIFHPPVWLFWLFLFQFSWLYFYYSRKIPISFADRLKINNQGLPHEQIN